MTNPYRAADSRQSLCTDYFGAQEHEAHEHHRERMQEDRFRFEDMETEREQKMWAEMMHYKSRCGVLEGEVQEALKIVGGDCLVENVRYLDLAYQELKSHFEKQAHATDELRTRNGNVQPPTTAQPAADAEAELEVSF